MKKLLTLFLLLMFFACVSYSEQLSARVIINSIDIISPDGDSKTYTNPDDVPNIDYYSKVIANGMLILNYHSIGIIVKNKQGLLVARHPITNLLIFSKLEGTRPGPIVVTFDATTLAQMSADTIFSLKYNEKENTVTMGIIDGHATLKVNDEEEIELVANETFKYKIKGEANAI